MTDRLDSLSQEYVGGGSVKRAIHSLLNRWRGKGCAGVSFPEEGDALQCRQLRQLHLVWTGWQLTCYQALQWFLRNSRSVSQFLCAALKDGVEAVLTIRICVCVFSAAHA